MKLLSFFSDHTHRFLAFFLLGIFILAAVLRLSGLGQVMTADEDKWVLRSSWFAREVLRGGFKNTFMTTHPATTLMWLSGTGIALKTHSLGVGTELEEHQLPDFLFAAKLPVALATSLLITLAAYLLSRIVFPPAAVIAGILIAADPYLTGLSQLVHLDALLALSLLCSLLALLAYRKNPTLALLILSGAMQGAALATKLPPALYGVIAGGVLLLFSLSHSSLRRSMFVILGWFTIAALTFYALCPAFWALRQGVGNENYTSGLLTSYKDDALAVATNEHIATAESSSKTFYLKTLVARSTPVSLLVSLGVLLMTFRVVATQRSIRPLLKSSHLFTSTILILYAAGFLLLITFIAKKGDRYALPALLMLPIVAGGGLADGLSALRARSRFATPALIVLLMLVITQTFLWAPYSLAYSNRFLDRRPLPQQGWGEGLDAAAAWLNQHPLHQRGKDFYVASWYPRVLGTFFHGTTLSLSSRTDHRVAFVVTYRNMAGRGPESNATTVLEEYQQATPVHVISIGGIPYVWIYETGTLRYFNEHTGELLPHQEVGQLIPEAPAEWNSLDIGFATFSSRANTNDVVLHIRQSPDSTENLRTVRINAKDISDSSFYRFTFEPLPDVEGKSYYAALSSPNGQPGNAVAVRFINDDLLPGTMFLRRRALNSGETASQFQREGDLAYRVSSEHN